MRFRRAASGAPIGESCGRQLEDLARLHDHGIRIEVESRRGDAERVRAGREPGERLGHRLLVDHHRGAARQADRVECRRCRPRRYRPANDCRRSDGARGRAGWRSGCAAAAGAVVPGRAAVGRHADRREPASERSGVAARRGVGCRRGVESAPGWPRRSRGTGSSRTRRPAAEHRSTTQSQPHEDPLPRMASDRSATRRGSVARRSAGSRAGRPRETRAAWWAGSRSAADPATGLGTVAALASRRRRRPRRPRPASLPGRRGRLTLNRGDQLLAALEPVGGILHQHPLDDLEEPPLVRGDRASASGSAP